MGAWGEESCSNDDCWDALCAEDIHEITTEEIKESLDQVEKGHSPKRDDEISYKQRLLGVVIWGLRHGCTVDERRLDMAKTFADDLRNDEEYLSSWRDPIARKDHLNQEILDIEAAKANKGQGKEEHIPGLLERIADHLEGEG